MTKKIRRFFPRLFGNEYELTSKRTRRYNCIAWAAGDTSRWWEPSPDGYWPPGVLDDGTVACAIDLFRNLGYSCTTDPSLVLGVEKIAIYADAIGYTHAARQLPDGRWTSKLGKLQDIAHATLANLIAGRYGTLAQIMERTVGGSSTAVALDS